MSEQEARDLFGPPPPPPSAALQAAAPHYPYCRTCSGYRPRIHTHNPIPTR